MQKWPELSLALFSTVDFTADRDCRDMTNGWIVRSLLSTPRGVPAADIQSLTERMDDIHYMFMSYDPRVIKWYWEKMPWVGEMFPAYLTHKAGISKPLLWMLLRGPFQGQQPHDLASQVVEFHNLQQTGNVLQFYRTRHLFRVVRVRRRPSPLFLGALVGI